MSKLKISLDELIVALTTRFDAAEEAWYLDTETGELLLQTNGAEDLPDDLEDNPRYLAIEAVEAHDAFEVMDDFVTLIADEVAVSRLHAALEGHKPFRRFKDVLLDFPEYRQAWFAFEHEAQKKMALEWCQDNDIEPEWR